MFFCCFFANIKTKLIIVGKSKFFGGVKSVALTIGINFLGSFVFKFSMFFYILHTHKVLGAYSMHML